MVVDNYEDLVKCGYLEIKLPRKHRKFGRQAWKRKWFILRRKSWQGQPRLEYHKSEEACLTMQSKTVVDLQTLVKIENSKSKSRKVSCCKLIFSDTFITLCADHESNMNEWVKLIKKLVLPEPALMQSLPIEEGSFPVTVINTGDSERMRLAGEYLLVVTNEHLSLHHAPIDGGFTNRNRPAVTWHLDDIPRFRLQKLNHLNDAEKIFIINLARTSKSTEMEFQFLTQSGREILESVKSKTKQRRQTIDESPRASPIEDAPATMSFTDHHSRTSSGNSELSSRKHSDRQDLHDTATT